MKKLSPAWKRAATVALIAAAAFFLFRSIARDWPRIREFDWNVDPLLLAASVLGLVGVLTWGAMVWGLVLRRFEHPPVAFGTLLRISFLSNLARYIPGTVFQFLTAAQMARGAGLSAVVLLTSLLVHTAASLLSAAVMSAWTLSPTLLPDLPRPVAGLAVTAAALLCVHPRLLNGVLGILPRLLKREVIRWSGSWAYGIGILALGVANWVLYGGAYWLLLRSLTPVSAAHLPMLSGVNALSFLAGWIVWIAPAGAGPREVVMRTLLLPLLPGGVASIIAVAARLWNVAGELLAGVIALGLGARSRRGAPPEPPAAP